MAEFPFTSPDTITNLVVIMVPLFLQHGTGSLHGCGYWQHARLFGMELRFPNVGAGGPCQAPG